MKPLDMLTHSLLMTRLMVLTLVSWNYLEASCKTFGHLHSFLIDVSVESDDANVVNLGSLLQNTWSTPPWWKYWECWHWSRRFYWWPASNQLNVLADHSLMVTFRILIMDWVILLVTCSKTLRHTDFHDHAGRWRSCRRCCWWPASNQLNHSFMATLEVLIMECPILKIIK